MSAESRAGVIRAIHDYGRAREQADYILGSLFVPPTEQTRRVERATATFGRVNARVAAALPETLPARAVAAELIEFGIQLYGYGDRRREGAGPDAAFDAIDAFDRLITAAERAS